MAPRTATFSLPPPGYLQERHFAAALLVAMCLHILAFATWAVLPQMQVLEIPVRILNIKLGEMEEDAPAPAVEAPAPAVMTRSEAAMPAPPAPKRIAIKPAENPVVPVQQAVAAKPPAPAPQAAQQYVRPQAFDYRPLGKQATSGSPLGNSTGTQAEIIARYEQLFSAWLKKFEKYPADMVQSRLQAQAFARIQVDRRGTVRRRWLEVSSGYPAFDRTALEMVDTANPFPPVPPEYKPGEALVEFRQLITFNPPERKKP